MYKTKLCMGLIDTYDMEPAKQVEMIKEAGFDGFFIEWSKGSLQKEMRKAADSADMLFASVHAPFTRMNAMWQEGSAGDEAAEELCQCVEDCAENNVPVMVAHAFIGFEDKNIPTLQGVKNFEKVVDRAEKYGLKVAFENTEGEEYLAALMEAFKDRENVGFCWDTGHEMCYNRSKDMLKLYGDRLFFTHINDNLGIKDFKGQITYLDDLHLLPFDGVADWGDIAKRLNRWNYTEILSFELNVQSKPGRFDNDAYKKMTPREYFTEAYKRACKVAALVQKAQKAEN